MTGVPTGKGQNGVIAPDNVNLPTTTAVSVTVDDPEDDYRELTAEEQAELESAIAAADRGEGVPWQVVRNQLRHGHR